MKTDLKIRSFLTVIFILSVLMLINSCDSGGSSSVSNNPATTGTIKGSVSGTTVFALDDDGMIVASDNTKNRKPDLDLDGDSTNESYSFILTEVPLDMKLRIYLITNEDVFPMFYEESLYNVFSLSSATNIDMGFVELEGKTAIPQINPLDFSGVNPEGMDTERIRICGVTIENFGGTWNGDVPYDMADGESGSTNVTLTLSVNGEVLVAFMESDEGWEVDFEGTESGGVFYFDLPNVHPDLSDSDCKNWAVSFTASLDCSLSKMDLTGGGTFCDISGGKPGTFTGFLNLVGN